MSTNTTESEVKAESMSKLCKTWDFKGHLKVQN